jgi:hypothetical protein
MRVLPQQEHADLGLVDDDRTPDMRPAPEIPVFEHRAGAALTHQSLEESR